MQFNVRRAVIGDEPVLRTLRLQIRKYCGVTEQTVSNEVVTQN